MFVRDIRKYDLHTMSTLSPHRIRWIAAIVLCVGIVVIASSSILIRFAQDSAIPSIMIAAIRLGISASVLSILVAVQPTVFATRVTWRQAGMAIAAGVSLAVHFGTWIQSLEYTSVASSAALVATNPIWVGIAAWLILKEHLNRWRIAGIVLTICGALAITYSDQQSSPGSNPSLGNALALIGAISGSTYFLLGRALRHQLALLPYIWMTYGSAAIVLTTVSLAFGHTQVPGDLRAWLILAGLALGPQLIGHTSINFAMRHFSALLVTIALLGEPVGSALLAFVLFQETFAPLQFVGFSMLLGGIIVTALGETQETTS